MSASASRTLPPRRLRRRASTAALVALLALLAVGCGSGDDAGSTVDAVAPSSAGGGFDEAARDDAAFDDGAAFDGDVGEEASEDQAGGGESAPGAPSAPVGEQVIRNAEITLEMEDTEAALDEVRRVTERFGGVVATADLRRDRQAGDLGGVIVVRVPAETLLDALDDLEALALDAPVRRIDSRDVTTEVVDLRARITNLTAYETELRALLSEVREAGDPDRLLPIVERIQSVRSEIDQLTARRDGLADQVARSTITVTIRPAPGSEPVPEPDAWTPGRTLERAIAATTSALTRIGDAAIWLGVTVVPVTLLLLAPLVLLVVVARRWRAAHPRPARPAAGSTPAWATTPPSGAPQPHDTPPHDGPASDDRPTPPSGPGSSPPTAG